MKLGFQNNGFVGDEEANAEEKIDRSEAQVKRSSQLLEQPIVTQIRPVGIHHNSDIVCNKDIIVTSTSAYIAIDIDKNFHRDIKLGSQRCRWNLLFNFLIWLIVPFPIWIPFISNTIACYAITVIQFVFVIMWIVISLLTVKNAIILYLNRSHNFYDDYDCTNAKHIRHVVVLSCYKESIDLLEATIQTVANQSEVERITMVVGFEERTPNKEQKCEYLEKQFGSCGFQRLIFTIHPHGLINEIAGKCSNSNYALRMAVKQMDMSKDDTDNILVTTCDADSKFPRQYLAALTAQYLKENRPALTTIYQAPLFYNWKLDQSLFVTRVTGLLRSFLMLGALIPFNINTMSIFSHSLSLAIMGNYIHPAYQMDDIICLIRWMSVTQRRLRISMIPVPVLSGPTCGETIREEVVEWARQARRWTIGAAEVFHYFTIKAKRMPTSAAFSWAISFLIYYGILLCTSGLYGLTSMLSMFLLMKNISIVMKSISYGLMGGQMVIFAIPFLIDIFISKLLNVSEDICIVRNIFHYLTTPFVLLGYSFVELYALHEIVIFGRKVCKHGASKKTVLT